MFNSIVDGSGISRQSKILQFGRKLLCATALFGLTASLAHAVPSYARQTGSDCASCHIGSFGPQLTPYGMAFKLGGYTDTDGKDGKIPLSAMITGSLTQNSKAPADGSQAKTNSSIMETSLFVAGRLTDNIGAFTQATAAYNERKVSLDQLDLRYARSLKLGDKETTVGLSLNNNPTLTDPFNTLNQWRFPYISTDFNQAGFGPAEPKINSLGGGVLGLNAYTFFDKSIYAELGLYTTPALSDLKAVNAGDIGRLKGPGTYGRIAYFKDMKRQNFSVGLFGFNANIEDRNDPGTADNFRDLGIDASYQFLGNRQHIFTVNTSYVKEWQKLNYTSTLADGASSNLKNTVNEFRLTGSYHYNQTWGVTTGLFDTRGSADAGLYPDAKNNRPDTAGYILQADWTPWGKENSMGAPFANVRLGAQFTGYTKFMGGSTYNVTDANSNTVDRKAKDNNTLMLFLWTSI